MNLESFLVKIKRDLDILKIISLICNSKQITLSDLKSQVNIPYSTIYRFLELMVKNNYLVKTKRRDNENPSNIYIIDTKLEIYKDIVAELFHKNLSGKSSFLGYSIIKKKIFLSQILEEINSCLKEWVDRVNKEIELGNLNHLSVLNHYAIIPYNRLWDYFEEIEFLRKVDGL
ncbi:MAG: hypothetical protein JXA99_01150 [Candidatus Lokiarchaeota archaeon]|nr:hypothetical protein [Candidatus Lokiarchaeota archaeon]